MSDVSKIVGNQESRGKHATKERESNKSNWQSGLGRVIIALLLITTALYIAAQEYGFFYTLLIALTIWWTTSAAEEKLSKSEQYKELIWHWPGLVKAAAIMMLALTVLHSGFGQSAKRGVEMLEGQAACLADSGSQACLEYRAAQAALDAPQLAQERQAEIEQAEHDATVQRAVVAAQAPQPVSRDSVVDGCTQREYEDALNCRTAELGPRMYYESSLDRGDPRARCTFMYPPVRESVVSLATTGPATNRVTNWSNSVRQVLVYEVYRGETGPDGQEC
jgi:hypothetical protein